MQHIAKAAFIPVTVAAFPFLIIHNRLAPSTADCLKTVEQHLLQNGGMVQA